ncbi:MAG: hypothetical protein MUC96_27990 [Myxococcaceae bacterium]|nr:hypothetical protein [Myxococcaceae bacterium]
MAIISRVQFEAAHRTAKLLALGPDPSLGEALLRMIDDLVMARRAFQGAPTSAAMRD